MIPNLLPDVLVAMVRTLCRVVSFVGDIVCTSSVFRSKHIVDHEFAAISCTGSKWAQQLGTKINHCSIVLGIRPSQVEWKRTGNICCDGRIPNTIEQWYWEY